MLTSVKPPKNYVLALHTNFLAFISLTFQGPCYFRTPPQTETGKTFHQLGGGGGLYRKKCKKKIMHHARIIKANKV